MKANIQRALRKWLIGAGCTLSVALLFQYARTSDTYQASVNTETSGYTQNDTPAANNDTGSSLGRNGWRERAGQREDSGSSLDDRSDSSSGDSFGFRSQTRAS
ncbi:hypothetical protein ACFPVX_00555 [Cohnella faecalis]|uniref:Uncharacterized protein n=1 Tax=Cohnella faecalis TaxID=2315694 RepID=A0A398CHF8_9BACL|nr:hypothetical protein [Cohnella faecalis]RIE02193.1 hypothetical protein D3H35_15745 [Cohnella faecalis]